MLYTQNHKKTSHISDAPVCAITPTVKDGSSALVCTAHANPQEVTFIWKVREGNETFMETNNIQSEGLRSYLILDSSIDAFRTYYCYANNSVDKGPPCHKDVPGKETISNSYAVN